MATHIISAQKCARIISSMIQKNTQLIIIKNMKLSKVMHVGSVIAGFAGVVVFIGAIIGGSDNLVFGITKVDALLCAALLILIAIWTQIATIHHMMLERKGEII
jgi:hypothetical protein